MDSTEQEQKMCTVYVDGVFDLFHEGHINFLKVASSYGKLIVGVHNDRYVETYKRKPVIPEVTRYEVVRSCRFVDQVIEGVEDLTDEMIDRYGISIVIHGDDFLEADIVRHYLPAIRRGIFQTIPYTKGVSSTEIISKIEDRFSRTGDGMIAYILVDEFHQDLQEFESHENVEIDYIRQGEGNGIQSGLEVDRDFMQKKYGFQICEAEIENFRSHRKAWARFLGSPFEFCLIMEQGTILNAPLSDVFESVGLNNIWDVFYPFDRSHLLGKGCSEPYFLKIQWGSFAYFVNKRGAAKLMEISTIRQPVDDELISLSMKGNLRLFTKETGFFHGDKPAHIKRQRLELIRKAIKNIRAWSDDDKRIIRRNLGILSELVADGGIDLILDSGSLLGFVRHNGIIPWDDDVDLTIADQDEVKFIQIIESARTLRYQKIKWKSGNDCEFYKIWSEDGLKINKHQYNFPFIDVWIYSVNRDKVVFSYGKEFEKGIFFPLREVVFENATYKVPNNPIACLDIEYSDWKEAIRVHPWSHKVEKVNFYPLSTPIEVDTNGKMLTAL